MLKGKSDVVQARKNEVSRGGERHGNLGREPGDSVGDALGTGVPQPDRVATVRIQGRADIPTVEGMGGPSGALGGLVVNEDTDAGRGNGGAVEVKMAKKLRPSRQLGIETGATEEIEGEKSLGEETIPEMEREVLVDAAKAGNEMIFERTDGAFGSIAAVNTRGGKLEIDGLVTKKLLEGGRAFVVKALELGAKASRAEAMVEGLVAGEDRSGGAAGYRLGKDAVAVVVVEYNHIIVAVARRSNKAASLVRVDLASRFHDGSKALMRTEIGGVAGRKGHIGGGGERGRVRGRRWVEFGGTLVLAALVEMAFNHRDGMWGIFAEEG
jgi:hypothetical protein